MAKRIAVSTLNASTNILIFHAKHGCGKNGSKNTDEILKSIRKNRKTY